MADIKLIPASCPSCGAKLSLPENSEKLFCMYCGTQILVRKGHASHKIECKICDGFGRFDICRACDGTGRCNWITQSAVGRNDIGVLGYSSKCVNGVCAACKGTGRYALSGCPGCEGTGKCPRCLGTGKCAACRGIGIIPSPNGSEKCLVCDGTGMMDPDTSTLPYVGRCPECKRVWVEDAVFCSHCGYKKK